MLKTCSFSTLTPTKAHRHFSTSMTINLHTLEFDFFVSKWSVHKQQTLHSNAERQRKKKTNERELSARPWARGRCATTVLKCTRQRIYIKIVGGRANKEHINLPCHWFFFLLEKLHINTSFLLCGTYIPSASNWNILHIWEYTTIKTSLCCHCLGRGRLRRRRLRQNQFELIIICHFRIFSIACQTPPLCASER